MSRKWLLRSVYGIPCFLTISTETVIMPCSGSEDSYLAPIWDIVDRFKKSEAYWPFGLCQISLSNALSFR